MIRIEQYLVGGLLLCKNEQDIIQLIQEDEWMMDILRNVKSLNLPDWWVCAGFVRSKIWDTLHGFTERTPLSDVDVIYFDRGNLQEFVEKEIEEKLTLMNPNIPWSVKNEARMHKVSKMSPYLSSVDAISKFPETATALGLTLDEQNNIIMAAPYGVEDVIDLIVKPTSFFRYAKDKIEIYENRIQTKNWKSIWNKIEIQHIHKYEL